MQPGLMSAVDPHMWIPKETFYCRVEDTAVVTETGVESLTPQCPLELEELEAVMNGASGLLQMFWAIHQANGNVEGRSESISIFFTSTLDVQSWTFDVRIFFHGLTNRSHPT